MLYHLAGYGMNSYSDWKNGFDKADPNKSHHPLNRGTLSKTWARRTVYSLLFLSFVYGICISLAYNSYRAAIVILLGFLSGIIYNEFGKYIRQKWLPISIAHSTVFIAPYIATGGQFTTVDSALMIGYVFLWVVFQIAISGELKDINQDEANFLRDMGCLYRDDFLMVPVAVSDLVVGIKALAVGLGMGIAYETGWLEIHILATFMLLLAATTVTSATVRTRYITRDSIIKNVTDIEILTAFAFVTATIPFTSWEFCMLVIAGSIIWVSLFNYIEWGSFISPQV